MILGIEETLQEESFMPEIGIKWTPVLYIVMIAIVI